MLYVVLFLIIMLVIGAYMNYQIMNPKTWTHKDAFQHELENGLIDKETYITYNKEVVTLTSDHKYKLYGEYYSIGSDKTVILCHGYGYNMIGSIKYIKLFRELGFNTLIYDHRYHGKSGGKSVTFGYIEKRDLSKWVDWIDSKVPNGIIGTHGVSMGGATVIQHASIDERVSFVIADCPYEDVYKQVKYTTKKDYIVPTFLAVYFSSFYSLLRGGGLYSQISPIKVVNTFKTPILLIHGKDDKYILPNHSVNLYNKRFSNKELYLVEGAKHAKSFQEDKEEYTNRVYSFLRKYKIIN